ncbi:TPA: hypothetical protein U2Q33_004527 [Citrobacter farmeri]|nr:hypothetical protein [Citrobacter farmeri]
MKILGISGFFVGACLIVSALIVSDTIKLKDEHVIELENGAVKLGNVYQEKNVITIKVKFKDEKFTDDWVLTNEVGVNGYQEEVRKKFQEQIDLINSGKSKDKNKDLNIDNMVLKSDATIELSTAVIYRSEHHPLFTLTLEEKTKDLAENTILLDAVTKEADALIKEQQPAYEAASYIHK